MKNKFIVIDGIDGCGKDTQIDLLKGILTDNVLFTREPGGTKYAERIRELLLSDRDEDISPLSDLLMFWAARDVHLKNLIIPALTSGMNVISNRFDSATFSFQIHGDMNYELDPLFSILRKKILADCEPFYIFLDLPPEVSQERMKKDEKRINTHFDLKPIEYHHRVREGFKKFSNCTSYFQFVDGDRPIEDVHRIVKQIVFSHFGLH